MLASIMDWGFGGIRALIVEWSLIIASVACLVAAGASAIYLPLVGRYVAAALVALSAGLSSYQWGYSARGRLDISEALEIQLKWANEELKTTQRVQESAAARAQESEKQAVSLQEKIREYETRHSAQASVPGAPDPCRLDASDVQFFDWLRDDASTAAQRHAPGRPR